MLRRFLAIPCDRKLHFGIFVCHLSQLDKSNIENQKVPHLSAVEFIMRPILFHRLIVHIHVGEACHHSDIKWLWENDERVSNHQSASPVELQRTNLCKEY